MSGVRAERELPVVWAVAKGSLVNKAILVPAALVISAVAPWAIMPLLMVGGLFLCYEGFEKLAHRFLHGAATTRRRGGRTGAGAARPAVDLVALEKDKIKGAIRTDFILSAEIIVITLGTVAGAPFGTRRGRAGRHRAADDRRRLRTGRRHRQARRRRAAADARAGGGGWARFQRALGRGILRGAPWLMKGLSVAGTAAMFLVGGGILTHGIPPLHDAIEHLLAGLGAVMQSLGPLLIDAVVGVIAGALTLAVVNGVKRLRGAPATPH